MAKILSLQFNKKQIELNNSINLIVGKNSSGKSKFVRIFDKPNTSFKLENKLKMSKENLKLFSGCGRNQITYFLSFVNLESVGKFGYYEKCHDYSDLPNGVKNDVDPHPLFTFEKWLIINMRRLFYINDLRVSEYLDFLNKELEPLLKEIDLYIKEIEYEDETGHIKRFVYARKKDKEDIKLFSFLSSSEELYLYLMINLTYGYLFYDSTIVIDDIDLHLRGDFLKLVLNKLTEISISKNIQFILTMNSDSLNVEESENLKIINL